MKVDMILFCSFCNQYHFFFFHRDCDLWRSTSAIFVSDLCWRVAFVTKYISLYRWHCLPTSNQLITQMLSNGACDLLMNVKEILQTTHTELCSSIFTRLWQRFARSIDLLIYEEVCLIFLFHLLLVKQEILIEGFNCLNDGVIH